jgi:hypothetical protein
MATIMMNKHVQRDRRDRIQNTKCKSSSNEIETRHCREGFQPRDSYYLLFDDRKKPTTGRISMTRGLVVALVPPFLGTVVYVARLTTLFSYLFMYLAVVTPNSERKQNVTQKVKK